MRNRSLFAGILLSALALSASSAFAQSSRSNSSASNVATSGASIVNNIPSSTFTNSRGRLDTTASAFAPGLTSAGLNSCAGSTSIGVGGTGFSFGAGTTWELDECTRRANAAALAGLGQNAAALEMLCESPGMKRALNASGTICPSQRAEYMAAQAQANREGRMVYGVGDRLPSAAESRRQARIERRAQRRAAVQAQLSNTR